VGDTCSAGLVKHGFQVIDFVVLNQGENVRKSFGGDVTFDLSEWVPLLDGLDNIVFPGSVVKVFWSEETDELLSVLIVRVVVDPVGSVGV
jgi:hypothetical protein